MLYDFFIKRRTLVLILLSFFVIVTILLYIFRLHPVASGLYGFIVYWSAPLSTAVVLVIAYLAYISIAENRRIREEDRKLDFYRRSLDEIRTWAKDAIRSLFIPIRQEFPFMAQAELEDKLLTIKAESISALADSKKLGRELEGKVKKACVKLEGYIHLVENAGSSSSDLENARRKLLSALIDVIRHSSEL